MTITNLENVSMSDRTIIWIFDFNNPPESSTVDQMPTSQTHSSTELLMEWRWGVAGPTTQNQVQILS